MMKGRPAERDRIEMTTKTGEVAMGMEGKVRYNLLFRPGFVFLKGHCWCSFRH